MKTLTLIFVLILSATALNAAAFEKTATFRTTQVVYSAEQPLAVGTNTLDLKLSQKGEPVSDAKVTVKLFMPEMPGMPYMEHIADAEPAGDGHYKATVSFAMPGTWQLHIFVETADGKKVRLKSSVNL